jgi:N-acylglucosamine 2-epimerase
MILENHSTASASVGRGLAALRSRDPAPMAQWLRGHLFNHVMPFWEKHAFDPAGGLITCISDTGEPLSHEKWLWSQWRAVWVFARIYNTLDRNPVWLRRAEGIAEFCLKHGWLEAEQGWALLLAQDGKVLRGYESLYVDGFAIYGLGELYRANGAANIRHWAMRTADAVLAKLAQPYDRLPHFPYPIPPGAKPHGIPMIFSLKLAELGLILGEEKYLRAARGLSEEVFRDFYDAESDALVEFASQSGGRIADPEGSVVVPGHVIEDMWFQLQVMDTVGATEERRALAHRLMLRHMELGWDEAGGGGFFTRGAPARTR